MVDIGSKLLSLAEIQEFLSKVDFRLLDKLNVTILRNITIESLEPYLKYFIYQIDYEAIIKFGQYDNILQDTASHKSDLLNEKTDCVLIYLKLDNFSLVLSKGFVGQNEEIIEDEKNRLYVYASSLIKNIRGKTDAMILFHGFESPVYPAYGIIDSQNIFSQKKIIDELNLIVLQILNQYHNVYFVDLNLCLMKCGFSNFYDLRYWFIGKAPYSREALVEIARENLKYIRAFKGKTKKCLVLDCDNTLWGGIIGEDGMFGIQLSPATYPGSIYYEFQQNIVNLYNRGVILALCSRNNEEDVWDVFRKHPDMVLKEEHISASSINWKNKILGLQQLSDDLNISLDSMVIVDDNPFEINMINEKLPMVTVIQLPKDKVYEYSKILLSCDLFDNLTISEEDKKRGQMYRAETKRKTFKNESIHLVDYYKSLKMDVSISFAKEFDLPRLAQLTQRTNQFNLTTKRYTESVINKLVQSKNSDVLYLKLSDIFCDSGIVGLAIIKYRDKLATIDLFLLSCRILGRHVEDLFLSEVIKLAEMRGCETVQGSYVPTKKNIQVQGFYFDQGFKNKEGEDTEKQVFTVDIKEFEKKEFEIFHVRTSDVELKGV